MKKFRVIVTGSNSFGVGEAIVKTVHLSRHRDEIELVCTSCYDMFYIGHVSDSRHVIPYVNAASYQSSIKDLYRQGMVNIIIPGSVEELSFFAEHKGNFPEFTFLMNNGAIIDVFRDKLKAAKLFPEYFPRTEERCEAFPRADYPLVRKKRFGKGAEALEVVYAEGEKGNREGFIFQKYIEGEEFTASLILQRDATFQMIVMRRELRKGATVKAEVVLEKRFEGWMHRFGKSVMETIGPFKVLNLQFRDNAGELKLLEVNPRISGSTSMRALFGFNEFDILLENHILNKPAQRITVAEGVRAIRGYEERIESQ